MGRKNSASFIVKKCFNLPPLAEKQIDSLFFGTKTLTLGQRLERGFLKIIQTQVFMLSLFVLIYWSNLYPLDSVSNLIAEGMVEDPDDITNAQVRFFMKFHREILGSLILTPIFLLALVKTYNTLNKPGAEESKGALMEPLLQNKPEKTF